MLPSLSRRLTSLAALMATLSCGCSLLPQSRPVAILARDAETGKPLADADVRVTYPSTGSAFQPVDSLGKTGTNGVARLTATPGEPLGATVKVSAGGYLEEEKFLTAREIEAIEPPGLFTRPSTDGPPTLTFALYAGPRPTVELIVADGYRGVVTAEVKAEEGASCPAGQRCFRVAVPSSGDVVVSGPFFLRRVDVPDFTARYASGTVIPPGEDPVDVGLWCMASEGNRFTFFIGTKGEFTVKRAAMRRDDGPSERNAPSSRRGGGGRRGGGRRGGASF